MVVPDRVPTQQATESPALSVAPVQSREAQTHPRMRRDVQSTRATSQHASLSYPRIPRLVSRYAKSTTPTRDSQFQANASHVQKPISLIAPVGLVFPREIPPSHTQHL